MNKNMSTQQTRLFKTVFYVLILQLIWGLINFKVNGEKINEIKINKNLLRINHSFKVRKLSQKVDCLRDSFNNCVCPGSCMTHRNNNSYCLVKNCYTWKSDDSENKGTCEQTGYNHVTPIVLSAIPFTSMIGIGYAIIERWDLFGMQLGILLGPCCLICCMNFAAFYHENKDDGDVLNEKASLIQVCSKCFSCCWVFALLIMWILSIIWVATPGEILDGDGCPLVF